MGGFADCDEGVGAEGAGAGLALLLLPPQIHAAQDAIAVRHDGDVFRKLEVDFFSVAAAQVEMVPVEGGCRLLDGLAETLVPLLLAVFVEAATANPITKQLGETSPVRSITSSSDRDTHIAPLPGTCW